MTQPISHSGSAPLSREAPAATFTVNKLLLPPGSAMDKYDGPSLAAARGGERRFHVMIKPGSSTCNLDCDYCFYLSKETLPGGPGKGRMSDQLLERFVQQYIAGVTSDEVVFSWQGGEPTLLGLNFFRKVVALEKKYARPGQRVENDLQTNGTLITDEWCEFLKQNRFLVGLSIDGPREIHDRYRVTKDRKPTFDRVLNAAKLLHRYGVPFNTLTCVNRYNGRHPVDVYKFLRDDVGSIYMQFIPIVERKGFEENAPQRWSKDALAKDGDPEAKPGSPDSIVTDWSVDPDDYGYFLCKVFDRWLSRDVGKIVVNQFESLVSQHLGLNSQICVYSEFCGKGVALEHDGSVYACDHYVYPEYCLGNVQRGSLDQMLFSREQVQFGYSKNEALPQYCRNCPYITDCWGECPKNRIIRTPDGEPGLNYLCRGLRTFFAHALPEIERIVNVLKKQPLKPTRRM